jgi:hypothetical protein
MRHQSGEQHQSYVLDDRAHGRRVAVYVTEKLVPDVRRGLDDELALLKTLPRGTLLSKKSGPWSWRLKGESH